METVYRLLGVKRKPTVPCGPSALTLTAPLGFASLPTLPSQLQFSQAHEYGCSCPDLNAASCVVSAETLNIRSLLDCDAVHDHVPNSLVPCTCFTAGGRSSCLHVVFFAMQALLPNNPTPIGTNFRLSDFAGSPQQHALLNRHLMDYFRQRGNATRSTPYNIPASQRHLLQPLGMEEPNPDAPETPHALHKSIEEFMLSRMSAYLAPGLYGAVSVKSTKLALLPPAGSVQNPVFEAKDVSRYPGTAIKHASLAAHETMFLHDVSSEVTPHELVERLVSENPEGQLFVTGMNPVEVLDRATSFEPSSHTIEYDLGSFNFIFTGSESESYFTPISVTEAWLRTSAVCASTGRVYHVVLLNYSLGHCLWHIFCGDASEQHTRTFGTGSMVRLPSSITGTLSDEYVPVKVLTGVLSFTQHTPDLSTRNLAAKVTQLSNGINPKTTARERWIVTHIARAQAPVKTWDYFLSKAFWNTLYLLSFQWQMLKPCPDVFDFIDERKRCRTIHPTQGGGWSSGTKSSWKAQSIPNHPTPLQRFSAFTGSAFTFLLPKILVGEVLSYVFMHAPIIDSIRTLVSWMDLRPLRVLLVVSIAVATAILPGHIVKIFTRLAGHFWRQLWYPGYLLDLPQKAITELTGAPGARWFNILPGRGWFFQTYLWLVGIFSVLPGLVSHHILPWATASCIASGCVPWFLVFAALIFLENVHGWLAPMYIPIRPSHHSGGGLRYNFRFLLRACWYPVKVASWFLAHSTKNRGNCARLALLPGLTRSAPQMASTNSTDLPIPAPLVMPANIPGAPVGVALAVDPTGMQYVDWLRAVEQAYALTPNSFPQLTPGQACFWDCVASYGGTAHMWYSWFMAYFQKLPDPNDPVVGNVTLPEIQLFCGASGFGLDLSGQVRAVSSTSNATWPCLALKLGNSLIGGRLHIELAQVQDPGTAIGQLARVLATIRVQEPASFNTLSVLVLGSPMDAIILPNHVLRAWAGTSEMPISRDDWVHSVLAANHAEPHPNNDAGTGFPFGQFGAFNPLIDFGRPVSSQPIAATAPSAMWRRFKKLPRSVQAFAEKLRADREPPVKIGASGTQGAENRRRHNHKPEVPLWWTLQQDLSRSLDPWKSLVLPDVPLQPERISFTPDLALATRLMADLKAHPEVLGPRGDKSVLMSMDSILDLQRLNRTPASRQVVVYFGVSGSGKTHATRKYLDSLTPQQRTEARIVCHTESLRAKTRLSLKYPEMRGFNFPTIASVLTEPTTGALIFDDAGKFWAGALDLILLTNPMVTDIVINGDPAQGSTCFPVRGTQSEHDDSAATILSRKATRYATRSFRMFRLLADTLGVYTTNSTPGHITHTVGPKHGLPVSTASPRYVGVLAGAGRKAFTYESVQGEDFAVDMEVDMTGLEGSVSDRTAYVALTRSSTGVYVHMDAANPASVVRAPPSGSDLMNAFVYALRAGNTGTMTRPDMLVKAAFYRHLAWSMPNNPWFASIGATVEAEVFQTVLPTCNTHFPSELSVSDLPPADHVVQECGPLGAWLPETHFHAKEHREVPSRGIVTDQFKETAWVNPHVHKRADTPTYFLSVAKRLTTRSVAQNLRRKIACPRRDLIDEFDKLVPHPPQFDASKLDYYVDKSVQEYCSKRTREQVLSKLASHDPDRTGSDIKISLKNQVIKKAEKRHKLEAIPGQLIHEYDIKQTLGDSAVALFLEEELIPAFPRQFLFYRRMSPEEFVAEYKARWRVDNGAYSSDVTRWDVGCDAGVVNFVEHVMLRCGVPKSFVDEYVHRRLSSRSQHGPMGTMQNSGDRFTWCINSITRAVVTSLVCELTPEDTAAINGDDAAIDRFATALPFSDSPWLFKDDNAFRVEFSGFELGGPTPEYSAEGLLYRTAILESRDPSAQDKWTNYLDLLRLADLTSEAARTVASRASVWMKPHLFKQFLPSPLRRQFNLTPE